MATKSSGIDFTEIEDDEEFEDLVRALLERIAGVVDVVSTGRGHDHEADLVVTFESTDEVFGSKRVKIVVQCKHKARSNRSVRKGEVASPTDVLHFHKAQGFLLVTDTKVGSYTAESIRGVQNLQDGYPVMQQQATSWERFDLESRLLMHENEDLLKRYFPKSWRRIRARKTSGAKSFASYRGKILRERGEDLKDTKGGEGQAMLSAYMITGREDPPALGERSIRDRARELGIKVTTSTDASTESIWSFETASRLEEYINSSAVAFAVVTRRGASSPNVWIEIEKARTLGKLRVVFIDQAAYSVTTLGGYPCVLLKRDLASSASNFETFFRRRRQEWGEGADRWFWFGLAILLSRFEV